MPYLSDVIKQRRSIRKYLPRQVSREIVTEVLRAAGWAPSAHNSQPWRFIVLEDTKVRQKLADAMAEAWAADLAKGGAKVDDKMCKERVERFADTPVLILACFTMDGLRKFPDTKRQMCERDLAVESLGAAMQNMLLEAHAKGLGACWFCAPCFCKGTVRRVLGIPESVEPQAFVAMGYPAEKTQVPIRKLLEGYCFVDIWGGPL
jgi:coenzyme F420-0:L-glutamate ligase / coenzyme F420-1:gamma-L-glutamate ligase